MSTSYVQEFAKIASVDDVYDIYELARLSKEAADHPEQLALALKTKGMAAPPPMHAMPSSLVGKGPVGRFGLGKMVGRLVGMR